MYNVVTLASGALMIRVAVVRETGMIPVPASVTRYDVVVDNVGNVRLCPPAVNVPPTWNKMDPKVRPPEDELLVWINP